MRKVLALVPALALMSSLPAVGADEDLEREIQILKQRVERLEKMLKEKRESEEEVAQEVRDIKKRLDAFELHGDAVLYYQGASVGEIEGEDYSNPSGTGYIADIELTFKPAENGHFYMRLHAGQGNGADGNGVADALYANLNTLADDNPGSDRFRLLEAYYTQDFLDGRLSLVIGKTEPFIMVDDNEYANSEVEQFVGKPFVNNPILDGEDIFAPMVGFTLNLTDSLSLSGVVQSNDKGGISWSGSEWYVEDKSIYDDVLDMPFYAVQLTLSPKFGGFSGNYRLYLWDDSADHIKIGEVTDDPNRKPSTDDGYGFGISFDQKITDNIGIFGRAAWANDEVYEVEQFYSIGASVRGLIGSRKDDTFGVGIAALIPNDKLENDDTEWHLEAYYRLRVSENLSITPDVQYIINPHGNGSSDNIVAGTIKAEFSF